MTDVLAPCPGRLVALADTPDPVFASEMVGPGVAIDPDPGEVTVVSPIAGKVVKVHPHAFVVLGATASASWSISGSTPFAWTARASRCWSPRAPPSRPATRWSAGTLSTITGEDISTLVPVVAMDRPKGSVPPPAVGATAAIGDVLFTVEA